MTKYKARKKERPGKIEELNTMREISLFIAMSLDGYIADSRGGVDWLTGQKEDGEMIDTYSLFIRDVDTVLMGWNT